MHRFLRLLAFIFVSVVLVACGGGGGSSSGGSSSGGTPAPVETDTLGLSQGAISFSVTQFEARPQPVTVTANVTGSNTAGVVFGTLPGVDSLPFWLDIQLGDFVNNRVGAEFIITRSDLPPGSYSFTVRAVTFDSSERVLDTADIVVTYQVAEGVPISLSPASVDVVMHYASEPITEVMSVTAGNYEWGAFSSEANLDIETATGSQDVTLTIFPAMEDLVDETGMFQGSVEVLQNGTSNSELFFINYTMFPTLENFGTEIFLNAVAGDSGGQDVGVNLRGTGLNWSVSSDQPWLSFSANSGVIETEDDLADSPDGDDFIVSVDGSTLDAGRHEAIITVTADAEQTLQIPVTIEVAAQMLEPSARGVALSQTATTAKLQSTINIATNASRTANWTASSNAAWLSVTASGSTADDLIVTADPSMLADESFSEGVVTLTSTDSEIAGSETIRVGFWKSAQAPVDTPVRVGNIFPEDLLVSDPIRPLTYVHSGETEINIVNVYTGVLEKTLTPSGQVFNFDVSDDGAFLYLVRSGEGEGFVDVVDLDTQEITTTWTYAVDRLFAGDTQDIGFGRVSNVPHIFLSSGFVLNADSGDVVPLASGTFPESLEVKGDVFCGGEGDGAYGCFDFVSAGFEGARLTSVNRATGATSSGQTILSDDGNRVFDVSSRFLSLFDTSDMSVLQSVETEPNDFVEDIVLDGNGTLYVTYRNDGEVPVDPEGELIDPRRFINVYDSNLNFLRTVEYPSNNDGVIPILSDTVLSGDDQRIIYLTNDEFLEVNAFSLD